jgi:hypothetical protein
MTLMSAFSPPAEHRLTNRVSRYEEKTAYRLGFCLLSVASFSSCASIQPSEVLSDDRITIEAAAASAADAVKAFRLRLASPTLNTNGTEPVVPDKYKSGMQFCKVDIVFNVSAKAGDGGKLTLSVPTVFNLAGPSLPLNTISPTVGAEQTSSTEALRGNTITFSMENPVCSNFDNIVDLYKTKNDIDVDKFRNLIEGTTSSALQDPN